MHRATPRSLVAMLFLVTITTCTSQPTSDRAIANRVLRDSYEHKLTEKPTGEVMVFVGKKFLGYPYKAGSLDRSDSEQLVVNLHGFDCVTLVENTLALARCIKGSRASFEQYRKELETIRYRGGHLSGYPSRLHYFTDWIFDNERKGIVKDVTHEIGGIPYPKHIGFMTSHRSSYPKLAYDSVFATFRQIEDSINARTMYYIPKSSIRAGAALQSAIRGGDIIAITTSKEGLDVSHVGIAVRGSDGSLRYLHAPDDGKTVTITKETLAEYLANHSTQTGIIVARPLDPNE